MGFLFPEYDCYAKKIHYLTALNTVAFHKSNFFLTNYMVAVALTS